MNGKLNSDLHDAASEQKTLAVAHWYLSVLTMVGALTTCKVATLINMPNIIPVSACTGTVVCYGLYASIVLELDHRHLPGDEREFRIQFLEFAGASEKPPILGPAIRFVNELAIDEKTGLIPKCSFSAYVRCWVQFVPLSRDWDKSTLYNGFPAPAIKRCLCARVSVQDT